VKPPFERDGDRIRMRLEPVEVELLESARQGLEVALGARDPDDPVVQRLFPRAVEGDPEADTDLRAMIHDDLLAERLSGLDELSAILQRGRQIGRLLSVDLVDQEPLLVLGVLNDVRLAIGARIGIDEIDRRAMDPDDPLAYRLAVMDHLGWWQEQLLSLLDPEGPTTGGP
jgi:hypothetical protein